MEKTLDELVSDYLKENKVSYRTFAKLAGIKHPTVANILKTGTASEATCRKIAKVLDLPTILVLIAAKLENPIPEQTAKGYRLLQYFNQFSDKEKEEIITTVKIQLLLKRKRESNGK